MESRILFNSKNIRDVFFEKSIKSLNFKRWIQLANFLEITRNTLGNYRKGKLTLPGNLYLRLSAKLYEKDKNIFAKNLSYLQDNWGRIKAGKITYYKYKEIFDEGRKKAINSVRKRCKKFNINLPINKEISYFIGLFIGDGFTNKYNRYYLIQFTGDKSEKSFYKTLISEYCKRNFNITPIIKNDRISKAIRVNVYSLDLFNLITNRFKIPAGRKSRTVLIPEEILKSEKEILKYCIRGIYDAEGCVFFDRRKFYLHPYPRVELHMNNVGLINQVYNILKDLKIKCNLGITKDGRRITIYGEDQVKKFMKEIGFSNPKHIKKLKYLN
ncbi:hypothetical protein HYW76_04255 [Candidatus Pacearchaeota archaeon]|nr:hypothetical protein [Candidatus Pacearchaeota archaeon]